MFKKILLVLSFLILFFQNVIANEISVKITPKIKYSACNKLPQVGDFMEFVTVENIQGIPKGTTVQGLLTEKEDNGFSGKIASYYIEQFKLNGKNLSGIVYVKGNEHPIYFNYFDWLIAFPIKIFDVSLSYVRGGEVFLIPQKDIFTLYLKD